MRCSPEERQLKEARKGSKLLQDKTASGSDKCGAVRGDWHPAAGGDWHEAAGGDWHQAAGGGHEKLTDADATPNVIRLDQTRQSQRESRCACPPEPPA